MHGDQCLPETHDNYYVSTSPKEIIFPKYSANHISNYFSSEDDDIVKVVANDPQQNEDGYFNATTIAAIYDDDDDMDAHKCVVTFDGYSQNLTTIITSGSCIAGTDFRILTLSFLVYFLFDYLKILV